MPFLTSRRAPFLAAACCSANMVAAVFTAPQLLRLDAQAVRPLEIASEAKVAFLPPPSEPAAAPRERATPPAAEVEVEVEAPARSILSTPPRASQAEASEPEAVKDAAPADEPEPEQPLAAMASADGRDAQPAPPAEADDAGPEVSRTGGLQAHSTDPSPSASEPSTVP
jgi:hypothetical protein